MLPFELTKDTPYLALSGELWSVFYEYFNRNLSCYKGFLLYVVEVIKLRSEIKPKQSRHIDIRQRYEIGIIDKIQYLKMKYTAQINESEWRIYASGN